MLEPSATAELAAISQTLVGILQELQELRINMDSIDATLRDVNQRGLKLIPEDNEISLEEETNGHN